MNTENFHVYIQVMHEDSSSRKKINFADIRPSVDYVISVENYANDLKAIPELANEDTASAFSNMEFLYNNMYREYYNDATRAIIATVFAKDIAEYGYTF